jgi:hypothetical protein
VELSRLDFERDAIPPGHDLVLLSRILMGLPAERAARLVRACAEALAPGGALAVHDYAAGSRTGALLSLDMLLHTGGAVHRAEVIAGWLRGAGLAAEPARRVLPYTRLWIGSKPA